MHIEVTICLNALKWQEQGLKSPLSPAFMETLNSGFHLVFFPPHFFLFFWYCFCKLSHVCHRPFCIGNPTFAGLGLFPDQCSWTSVFVPNPLPHSVELASSEGSRNRFGSQKDSDRPELLHQHLAGVGLSSPDPGCLELQFSAPCAFPLASLNVLFEPFSKSLLISTAALSHNKSSV